MGIDHIPSRLAAAAAALAGLAAAPAQELDETVETQSRTLVIRDGQVISSDLATPATSEEAARRARAEELLRQAEAMVDGDPIRARLFPPEDVILRAAEIDLTADQTDAIIALAETSQGRMTRFHLETAAARADLVRALDDTPRDVERILAALDAVLERERQVKLEHFSLLLRVRNELTDDQVDMLRLTLIEETVDRRVDVRVIPGVLSQEERMEIVRDAFERIGGRD